ncbi:MAG: GNAT family N-acetyltransferase [Erysipelotrichaceae bacterium]|nr:GNAT family N-acetyltransferase [Erysipelotrichaceae bacterium]
MKQVFESENIRFVEVSEQLIEEYLIMVNDYENVNRFLGGQSETYTPEQERNWVKEKLAEKAQVFSMIGKKNGEFIGNIEFFDLKEKEAELGIALTAKMQDRGYGTEAIRAFTEYGTDHLGLTRIRLRANTENGRAIHVYEKCGFREYARNDEEVSMELFI